MKKDFNNPTEEQKELIQYWIIKYVDNVSELGMQEFIKKHLSPKPKIKKREIEERIIKEAIDRGLIKGARFNSPDARHHFSFDQEILNNDYEYDTKRDTLFVSTSKNPAGGSLFCKGKWAEVIKEASIVDQTIETFERALQNLKNIHR